MKTRCGGQERRPRLEPGEAIRAFPDQQLVIKPLVFSALDGRVQFILKENPERKIYHTVQVERNGFVHSMVSGTPNEGKGYEYFGPRAYSKWIQPEVPGTGNSTAR